MSESAAIRAMEVLDSQLARLVPAVLDLGGALLITADHGNAEWMFNKETKAPQTAHTTNMVPFIVVSKDNYELEENGALCDIAPSILDILIFLSFSSFSSFSLPSLIIIEDFLFFSAFASP